MEYTVLLYYTKINNFLSKAIVANRSTKRYFHEKQTWSRIADPKSEGCISAVSSESNVFRYKRL